MNRASRDAAPPLLALVLAVLALPAAGLVSAAWLPTQPEAYAHLALVVSGLAFLAWGGQRRGLRPLLLLLAVAPALLFGLASAGARPPAAGWWGLWVLCGLLAWLPRGQATALAVLAGVLGVGLLLGSADAGRLARLGEPLAGPRRQEAVPATDAHPDAGRRGVRRGAAVAPGAGSLPAFGEGPGRWFVEAETATRPGPRPVVLVLGPGPVRERRLGSQPVTQLTGSEVDLTAGFALRGVDAVVALEGAWAADDAKALTKARALATYVRGGGLLIGPAPGRPWPARVGLLLRDAGRSPTAGAAGARRLGSGWIARAAHARDVVDVFEADLWVRDVGTSLLDSSALPAPLASWRPWADRPSTRRIPGVLLFLHALGLAVFARLLRRGPAQLLGAFLVAAAVLASLAWTLPQDPGIQVEGAVVDLGGRRFEAVWIDTGPRGFTGAVRFRGGGVVGHRGGRLLADGRLRIEPGHSAWVVRETAGREMGPEDRTQAAILGLLRGTVDPKRIRLGSEAALPVRVTGWGRVPAASVLIRPPQR